MSGDAAVLLGVKGGPALNPGGSTPTATLLRLGGFTILVDCGVGCARALTRAGAALPDLDLICVTHLHSDHYLDLGPLLHTAWTAGLKRPIPVLGPPRLDAYWRHFLEAMRFDVETRIADEGRPDPAPLAAFAALAEGEAFAAPGLRVTALRNVHPPIAESYALRIEAGGRAVVCSGDTAFHPPLAGFAAGADLLIHEAMLAEGVERLVARVGMGDRLRAHLHASHTTAEDAGRIARDAGVGALALNHLVPADDPAFTEADWARAARAHWDGPLFVGRDGLQVPLG